MPITDSLSTIPKDLRATVLRPFLERVLSLLSRCETEGSIEVFSDEDQDCETGDGELGRSCPICSNLLVFPDSPYTGWAPHPDYEVGHDPYCDLQALINELREELNG